MIKNKSDIEKPVFSMSVWLPNTTTHSDVGTFTSNEINSWFSSADCESVEQDLENRNIHWNNTLTTTLSNSVMAPAQTALGWATLKD